MLSGINKLAAERNQRILLELASQPGNDVCADCKTKNPRWASYNLGIFLCVGCASIHRKIGTHVSKVKSLTLDSWTKEQVDRMKEMGNFKSNAIYNPNEIRNPPPPSLEDPTRDSDLEKYIRSKYEYRRFLDRSALVASKLGPSRSVASVTASASRPTTAPPVSSRASEPAPRTATDFAAKMFSDEKPHLQPKLLPSPPPSQSNFSSTTRSASNPVTSQNNAQPPPSSKANATKPEGVWADLISLQEPAMNASLPLQYQGPVYTGMPGLAVNNAAPATLATVSSAPFANQQGLPSVNNSQPSFNTNPFSQQSTIQNPYSTTPFSAASPFPSNAPQMSQGYTQSPAFPNQMQTSTPQIPVYQPQPQPLLTAPAMAPSQFLSTPSPNPPPPFNMTPHSPQPQSMVSVPNQAQMGMGYMNPSPQSMSGTSGGMGPGGGLGPMQQMQSNLPQFGGVAGLSHQQQPITGQYGQMQFTPGVFPGQMGPQWGPL